MRRLVALAVVTLGALVVVAVAAAGKPSHSVIDIDDVFTIPAAPAGPCAFEIQGHATGQIRTTEFSDERGYFRETNRAGGLEGGMTTGNPLVVAGAMKPLPTLTKPLRSVDTETKEPAQALRERTDSCTVPAAGVVGEAMVALVLASAYRDKLGGDHIDDARAALMAYEERIGWRRA